MQRKISTLLDEGLYRRVKLHAVRRGRPINEVFGEALRLYLDEERSPAGVGGLAQASFGAVPVDARLVREVLEEEDGLFDA